MQRSLKGLTLVEAVADMTVMVPILVCFIMVIAETSHAYVIKQGLVQCAREAARNMQAIYDESSMIVGNRSLQNSLVYDNVRLTNTVNASAQFDDAQFVLNTNPPTVKVTVHFTSGQNGLPSFPMFDPLNLGSNYKINADATYALY